MAELEQSLLGSVNATYFSLNGFLPDYLNHIGRSDLIGPALTALNLGQLPASFLLLASAERLVRHVWPYAVCGLVCLGCALAIVFAGGPAGGVIIVTATALLGCFAAAILVMVLALPPLISQPGDVHRVTAGMFTISYSCAIVVPVISGALWDGTGIGAVAFVPIIACLIAVVALAPTVVLRDKTGHA